VWSLFCTDGTDDNEQRQDYQTVHCHFNLLQAVLRFYNSSAILQCCQTCDAVEFVSLLIYAFSVSLCCLCSHVISGRKPREWYDIFNNITAGVKGTSMLKWLVCVDLNGIKKGQIWLPSVARGQVHIIRKLIHCLILSAGNTGILEYHQHRTTTFSPTNLYSLL
jgi:hypothetical protein